MRINKKAVMILIIGIFVSIALGFFALSPMISDKLKTIILTESQNTINGEVTLSEVKLIWLNKVQLTDIRIQKDDRELANIPKLNISIAWWNLFANNKLEMLESMTVYSPTINLSMDADQHWNILDLLKPSPESNSKFVSLINLRDAKLNTDINGQMLNLLINGSVDARMGDDNYTLDLMADEQNIGVLKVVGMINVNRQGRMNISAKQLNLAPLKKILNDYLHIEQVDGEIADVDVIWQNQKGKKLINGRFDIQNVRAVYPYEDKKFDLSITGPVAFKDNEINFKHIQVAINGQVLTLDGGIIGNNDNWLPDNLKVDIKQADLSQLLAEPELQGKLDAEAVFKTDNEELNFVGNISSDKITFWEYEFNKLNIPFSYKEKKLYIDGAVVESLNGNLSANAVYNSIEKRYNLEVSAKALNLGNLRIDDLSGIAQGKLIASGKVAEAGQKFDLAGTLTLDELSYKGMNFSEISADVFKFQDAIDISSGSARLANLGQIAFFGSLQNDNMANLYLTASSVPLEYITQPLGVSSSGNINVRLQVYGDINNPGLRGMINTAEEGSIAGLKFDNLQTNIAIQDKIVDIQGLDMITSKILDTKDGKYSMSGQINMQGLVPVLNLHIETKNVRVDDLMRENFGANVTGYFNSRIDLAGALNNPEASGRAILHQGSVNGFDLKYIRGEFAYRDAMLSVPILVVDSLTGLKVRANGTMQNDEMKFDLVANDLAIESVVSIAKYGASGNINFDGKVTGNFHRPQFEGFVNSEELTVFGEKFTNIIGKISSDAGMVTEAMLDFKEAKGGEFYFSGGLDYLQNYAYGKFIVNKANIEPFLTFSNEDYGVKGLLDGEIYLNRNGKGSGTEIIGHLSEASIADLPIQEAEISIFVNRDEFVINKFIATQGEGSLEAYGRADFRGNANITINGQNLNAQLLAVGRKKGLKIDGHMNIHATVTGRTLRPDIDADINIVNGGIGNMNFDLLTSSLALRDNSRLDIKNLQLSKMGFVSSLSGSIPLDLFKDKENRLDGNQGMNLVLKTQDANLGILTASSLVNYSSGSLFGDLKITGTLEEPKIYGDLRVKDGTIKLDMFKNPLTDINLDISFDGQYINMKEASARMGKGRMTFGGNLNIDKRQNQSYSLWGKAIDVDLESLYVKGLLNGDFSLTPQPNRNRAMLNANVNLNNMTFIIPGIPDFGSDSSPNLGLNLHLNVGNNVRVLSKNLCDLYLTGGMRVLGSVAYPIIDGNIGVEKGTITYLRTQFKIEKAVASYPLPGTYIPNVNIEAIAKLLQYDIKLQARGPVTNMDLKLTSNPPRSQQELFRLLTLRVESNSSEFSSADARGLLITGLQMSVFGDVEYAIRNNLSLNEFRIYQGDIATGTALDMTGKRTTTSKETENTYNILVSKYLTDRLLFGYTTAVDFKNYMLYAQYSMNRNFNISVGIDELHKKKVSLEYKVTF